MFFDLDVFFGKLLSNDHEKYDQEENNVDHRGKIRGIVAFRWLETFHCPSSLILPETTQSIIKQVASEERQAGEVRVLRGEVRVLQLVLHNIPLPLLDPVRQTRHEQPVRG